MRYTIIISIIRCRSADPTYRTGCIAKRNKTNK